MAHQLRRVSWDELRSRGLLWLVNRFLFTFGYAITIDLDREGKVIGACPVRTAGRWFKPEDDVKELVKFHRFLAADAHAILEATETGRLPEGDGAK